MLHSKKGTLWCLGCVLSIFMLLNAAHSTAQEQTATSTLQVRGEAQLLVSPDQVVMSAGVVTEAASAKKALAENRVLMNKVMVSLGALGINKKAISTQSFTVQPLWSLRPRNAPANWKAQITGYRVNNSVQVKTTQINLIGDMINAVTKAGANQIPSVYFGLSNPRAHRSAALAQAVDNARADAEVVAKAAGTRIKAVQRIQLDQAIASFDHVEKSRLMHSASVDAAPSTPITAGDVTVRTSVSITYELEQ